MNSGDFPIPAEEFQAIDRTKRNDEITLGPPELCNLHKVQLTSIKPVTLDSEIPPYELGPYIRKVEIPFAELYGGLAHKLVEDESSILKADTRENWTEALKKLYEDPKFGKLLNYNSIRPSGLPIKTVDEFAENAQRMLDMEPQKHGIVTYGEPGFYSIDEKTKNAPVAYEVRHGMSDEEMQELMRRKKEAMYATMYGKMKEE